MSGPGQTNGIIAHPVRVIASGGGWTQIDMLKVQLPELPSEVRTFVEENWQYELRRDSTMRRDEPIVAATGVSVYEDRLVLTCGDSNRGNITGTTSQSDIAEEFRHRAVGFQAITTTADNCVIVGQRRDVSECAGRLHLAPSCRFAFEHGNPIDGVLAQFEAELCMGRNELCDDLRCVAVLSDLTWSRQSLDFVFAVSTRLTSRDVLERFTVKVSKSQFQSLASLGKGDSLGDVLRISQQGFVPVSWAALAMIAGVDWKPTPRTYAEHIGVKELR